MGRKDINVCMQNSGVTSTENEFCNELLSLREFCTGGFDAILVSYDLCILVEKKAFISPPEALHLTKLHQLIS